MLAIADVEVQIPQREAAEAAMLELQAAAAAQDGCLSFAFTSVLSEPGHYLLLARWRDHPALEEHFRSAAYQRYQRVISALVVRDSRLELFSAQALPRPLPSEELDLKQDD